MGKARKASAAASAAAMHKAGFNTSTFVGFDAFATATTSSASTSSASATAPQTSLADRKRGVEDNTTSYYAGSHNDIKQTYKSLSKKDAQTKFKALAELSKLVESEQLTSREDVREALPHFLYHYLRICSREVDHRVRERANVTLCVFLRRVPKVVIRSSSDFLGETFCCVGDPTNADVNRAAREVLRTIESIDLVENLESLIQKNEGIIMAFLKDRMYALSLDGMEDEVKERLQASSLGALARLPELLRCESRVKGGLAESFVLSAVGQNPRWKTIFTHSSSLVRGATYELVAMLSKEHLLDSSLNAEEACSLMARALSTEQESRLVGGVAEAIVTMMQGGQFFSILKDYRKTFFASMWSFMRRGARGAGRLAYPMLLPILSLIPTEVWDEMGSESLANKWLEELWSGMSAEEDLGPHGTPALLHAQLECAAFLLKNKRSFSTEHLLRPIEVYICENRRFRLGRDLPATLALALNQVPPTDNEAWRALQQTMEAHFLEDATRAERVAEIVEAAGAGSNAKPTIAALAKTLVDTALNDTRRCPSLSALDVLVSVCGVVNGQAEALLRTARLRRDGAEGAASFRLALRVCLCGPQSLHERDQMWRHYFEGLQRDSQAQQYLADALSGSKSIFKMGDLSRLEGSDKVCSEGVLQSLVESVLGCPTPNSVGALSQLGWLDDHAIEYLEKSCCGPLLSFVEEYFGREEFSKINALRVEDSHMDEQSLGTLAEVIMHLPTRMRPESAGLALITKALLQPRAPTALNTPAVVESWLQTWLVSSFENDKVDSSSKLWSERAKLAWAHLARGNGRSEAVFTALKTTSQSRRLVHVAMHVSEEVPEGECLGFAEPALLLWKLLLSSDEHRDWRSAVLVPYIVHAQFDAFVEAAVDNSTNLQNQMNTIAAIELFQYAAGVASLSRDNVVLQVVKTRLVPDIQHLKLALPALETLVKTMSTILQDLGVKFDDLVASCAEQLMNQVPDSVRDEAMATADAFISVMKGHEASVEEENLNLSKMQSTFPSAEDVSEAREKEPSTKNATAVNTSGVKLPSFNEGEEILYTKTDPATPGVVSKVHLDDPSEPYYTIAMDSREVQTTEKYLQPKHRVPETLSELNEMLAQARKAGDHKESLRLMKLLPSLTPKPVDSDQQRKEALAAAKARRQRALEQMAEAQAQRRQSATAVSGSEKGGYAHELVASATEQPSSQFSQLSSPSSKASLCHNLEQFGVLTGSGRGARLGPEELRRLLCVAAALEAIAQPRAVAAYFRQASLSSSKSSSSSSFRKILMASIHVMRSVLENVPSTALPGSLHDYLTRVLVNCALFAGKDIELLQATALTAACMDTDDEGMHKILEKCAEMVLSRNTYDTPIPKEVLDLFKSVPTHILRENENAESMLRAIVNRSEETARVLASIVESCAGKDHELAKAWWQHRVILLEGVIATSSSHQREFSDEAPFADAAWCSLVSLIHENREADAEERDALTQSLEDHELVGVALRWSLLGMEDEFDDSIHREVAAQTLRVLPALSRKWFMDSTRVNRAEYSRIRMLMAKSITPRIVNIEIADIDRANREHAFDAVNHVSSSKNREHDHDDMEDFGKITVRASLGARVVTALYEKEDCSVEMEVRIPNCYPLENVQVECVGQVGISRDRWRRWVMQINTLLTNQNGTLLDALLLWKLNMDKELEGMEPCPICYAVVHANDQSFPRLKCSVCKNSYHSRCLVKWFRTSHKNECPMCKQTFEFE